MELIEALALIYFPPTLVAIGRGVLFIDFAEAATWNLLLGWTLIGWGIALALAMAMAIQARTHRH